MIRVLITGGSGQLGRAFTASAQSMDVPQDTQLIALDRSCLTINDQESIQRALAYYQPEVVINAAAYTAVDQAEIEAEKAYAINAEAAALLATQCVTYGAEFIHLSTDYVFDGAKGAPYEVDDKPNPVNIYGQSKLAGEQAVLTVNPEAVIVRTAWLYSEFGENFQTKILRAAKDRLALGKSLQVVNDQWGSPTEATCLVSFLLCLSQDLAPYRAKTLHFSSNRVVSRLDLAKEIVFAAFERGELEALPLIEAAKTEDYPALAKRPINSALKSSVLNSHCA